MVFHRCRALEHKPVLAREREARSNGEHCSCHMQMPHRACKLRSRSHQWWLRRHQLFWRYRHLPPRPHPLLLMRHQRSLRHHKRSLRHQKWLLWCRQWLFRPCGKNGLAPLRFARPIVVEPSPVLCRHHHLLPRLHPLSIAVEAITNCCRGTSNRC